MDLDHREMVPPFVHRSHSVVLAGSAALIWDIRIGQPNVAQIPAPVLHSLEHALIAYLREKPIFVHAAPMGCGTGLYLITAEIDHFQAADLLTHALGELLKATDVPLRSTVTCGAAGHHDLTGAQEIARWMLSRRDTWDTATSV